MKCHARKSSLAEKCRGYGSEKMMIVEEPGGICQNPDALPDATATYCLPLMAYVTTPPFIAPPVLKRCSTFPVLAFSARKSPVNSPVKTRSAEVVVTEASIG